MALADRPPRKIVVSAAIAPADLDHLDQHARSLGRSRSELIAEAVRTFADSLDAGQP